jgi:KUP system potassium uptake protein
LTLSPAVWIRFVKAFAAIHEVTIFAHLRQIYAPKVSNEDRFEIRRTGLSNCYRVLVRFGYSETVGTASLADFATPLREWLNAAITRLPPNHPDVIALEAELSNLLLATDHEHVSFLLDKTELVSSGNVFVRTLHGIFCFMRNNTRSRPSYWRLPADKLIELGGIREI